MCRIGIPGARNHVAVSGRRRFYGRKHVHLKRRSCALVPVAYLSIASLVANLGLAIFVISRKYSLRLLGPLCLLSVVVPLTIWLGFAALDWPEAPLWRIRLFFFCYNLIPLALIAALSAFVQDERVRVGSRRVRANRLAAAVAGAAAICAGFTEPALRLARSGIAAIALDWTAVVIMSLHLGVATYALYVLENAYRYAEGYQRRIGRMSFLAAAAGIIVMILTDAWVLLFRTLTEYPLGAFAAVIVVSFPFALAGLIRYRLGSERIAVPREVAYSSYALLGVGALLVSLGVAAGLVRLFGMGLPFLWSFLVAFSLFFFAMIALGSRRVRYRLALFVDRRFYPIKYDYRKQFFGLHHALHEHETLDVTLMQIIENLRASGVAEETFLFINNERRPGFHIVPPRECRYRADLSIPEDSPLIETVRANEPAAYRGQRMSQPDEAALKAVGATAAFPVRAREELVGVLALRMRDDRELDYEDTELINAFAHAVGDAIFKHRVLEKRLERKQFESFLHVSSFIVHDIKNQASTLTLLMKNAEKNIGNPEFQKSLLRALASSAHNLESLVAKLRSVPRAIELRPERTAVAPIVRRVVDDSGIHALPGIDCRCALSEGVQAHVDGDALYHVVKNLTSNAHEAMPGGGTLRIGVHLCAKLPDEDRRALTGIEALIKTHPVIVTVADTGAGMSREFIQNRLFHPFATTKDKGVGIGLYQSKSLIERMGGKIICQSEPGKGTIFGVLLR
jgi:putative PEP-CTERM system histidine kinase